MDALIKLSSIREVLITARGLYHRKVAQHRTVAQHRMITVMSQLCCKIAVVPQCRATRGQDAAAGKSGVP